MIEKIVLRDARGRISRVVERQLSRAEAAAVATWARLTRDVLPEVWSVPADGPIVIPCRIDPPDLAQEFGEELLRLARRDAGAWSAWSVLAFTINGAPAIECHRAEDDDPEAAPVDAEEGDPPSPAPGVAGNRTCAPGGA